jgi:hypothetical protein
MSFAFDGISGGGGISIPTSGSSFSNSGNGSGFGSRTGVPSFSNPNVHGPPTCPVNNEPPKFGDPTFVGPPTRQDAPPKFGDPTFVGPPTKHDALPKFGDPTFVGPPTKHDAPPKFGDPTFVGPPTRQDAHPKFGDPTFVGPPTSQDLVTLPENSCPIGTNTEMYGTGDSNTFGFNLDGTLKGGSFGKSYNYFFPSNEQSTGNDSFGLSEVGGLSNWDVYGNVKTGAPSIVYSDGKDMVNINGSSKSISVRHIENIGGIKIGVAASIGAKGANSGIVTRDGEIIKECGVGVDTDQGWKNEAYGYCKYTQVVPQDQVSSRLAEVKIDDFRQEFNVPLLGTMGSARRETNATGRTITTIVRGGITANGAATLVPMGVGTRLVAQGGGRIIQVLGSIAVVPVLAGAD